MNASGASHKAPFSRALYRALLLAYPAEFRRDHGRDAVNVFADLARATRRRGATRLIALWMRSVPAVARGGLQERRDRRRSGTPHLSNTDPPRHPRRRGSLDTMTSELRHSVRALLRRPGFTLMAVLTLALGLGATTAVFSVVDAVLLRPLPYPEPEELAVLSHTAPEIASGDWGLSSAGYFYFREHTDRFEELAAYSDFAAVVTGSGSPERIRVTRITASLLPTLGVSPARGRPITPDDDQPGSPLVVLLSHGYWLRAYGGDPGVLGSSLLLSDVSYEVIGVMSPGFGFPTPTTDVWVAHRLDPTGQPVNSHYLESIARLRDGVTVEEAHSELGGLLADFAEEMPTAYGGGFMERSGFRVNVVSLLDETVGGVRALLWIVLAAAALVLVIACANVANLTLLRAESRRRELAVRGALGANRMALLRYALSESLVVALVGGVIGVGLAWGGVRLVGLAAPTGLPRVETIGLRPLALLVAFGAVLAVALVLGAVAALHGSAGLVEQLKSGGRAASADRGRMRARNGFVVAQVAIVVLLMVGSGVLLRSFLNLRAVDPGFDPDDVLTLRLTVSPTRYGEGDAAIRFFGQVADQLRRLQGVTHVGVTSDLPLVSRASDNLNGVADLPDGAEQNINIDTRFAGDGFFEALRMRLVEGRTFERRDMDAETPGAIVSRALAQELWPGRSAVGKRMRPLMRDYPWHTIVGVIDDVREEDLTRAPEPVVYFPYADLTYERAFTLVIRTEGAPTALLPAVRSEVWTLDPDVAISGVAAMRDLVRGEMSRTTFTLTLIGVATGMALFLCAVGIYGVIAYSVRQRRFEIGVRMALGAQASRVARMVIGQTLALTAVGLVVGVGLALAGVGVLESFLYEVEPNDPLTLAGVVVGLAALALAAGAFPARRATRVDAIVALQGE